jgi:hypothetical protein
MVARITAAEAKRLGIETKVGRTRTTSRTAKGVKYHTICVECGEEFTVQAAEDRHVDDTRHARYALIP